MSKKQEGFITSADSGALVSHFQTAKEEHERMSPSKLFRYAKKLSTAEHHKLMMKEATTVTASIDKALEEVDLVLAERQAYSSFVRKRAELWNHAHKKQMESGAKSADVTLSCDTSSNASSSNATSSFASDANAKEEDSRPKKPSLADYGFSEETLSRLNGESSFEHTLLELKRPKLQDYLLDSAHFLRPTAVVAKVDQMAPPERPKFLAAPIIQQQNVSQGEQGSSGSKCSTGSLMGSFLSYPTADFDIVTGPVVRADLGLNDKSVVDGTGPISATLGKPLTKPSLPKLMTTSFDS